MMYDVTSGAAFDLNGDLSESTFVACGGCVVLRGLLGDEDFRLFLINA